MKTHPTLRWQNGQTKPLTDDAITPEAPLAIRLRAEDEEGELQLHELAMTMRSPGHDADLVRGYLFAEGIIHRTTDIAHIQQNNDEQIEVTLASGVVFSSEQHERYGYTTSSCGLCGKTSLEQLEQTVCYFPAPAAPQVAGTILCQLPGILQQQQLLFQQTGGIHAAALFRVDGELLLVQEDVGRHNAFDKLCGKAMTEGLFPWRNYIILVSGRLSYELVQKAAMAGTPILAAIGAPSSLAIELAEETGITLVGFLRQGRFNVYTYPERIR